MNTRRRRLAAGAGAAGAGALATLGAGAAGAGAALGAGAPTPVTPAVEASVAAITPDTIGKFLLTSGSTGSPKAVINTQRMMCANVAMGRQSRPRQPGELPHMDAVGAVCPARHNLV